MEADMNTSYDEKLPEDLRNSGAGSSTQSCGRSRAAVAQYGFDAKLLASFERCVESGASFRYADEVISATGLESLDEDIPAYLTKIQRGGLVQPHGCLLCVDPTTFSILAHSENLEDCFGGGALGMDARALLAPSSAAALTQAMAGTDLALRNPIWVQSVSSRKHFYAILHRIDVGVVVDLEPAMAKGGDPGVIITGSVQSQKLAAQAITKLQALPGGHLNALLDGVVESVRELTGYDRVMVYKFHEDEHGEVVAEARRPDLDSYLGLHYPATDIPQVTRFLFEQNRVRMICDCHARPVGIVQELTEPLCLVNSTLRAPHACHAKYMANMGSIASLTMAILVNAKKRQKLWGLVACHHTSVYYVPYPVRCACEFLTKAFSIQLGMELSSAAEAAEKRTLRIQTLLYDRLLTGKLARIAEGSPNIMDLVKCDGAALYHDEEWRTLGTCPGEARLSEIVHWLQENHRDSTGISTESLTEAGFPGAVSLVGMVCGMACVRIRATDFVFWFRSGMAKEVTWGGVRRGAHNVDDCNMLPRVSCSVFLESMRNRSRPWLEGEINAIHSLQLIARDCRGCSPEDVAQVEMEVEGSGGDDMSGADREMVRLVETASVPIIAVDRSGFVIGWNAKAAELTGLAAREAMGRSLVGDLVHEDSREAIASHLSRALEGHEDRCIELKLRTFGDRRTPLYIEANACASKDSTQNIVGVRFVGQDVTQMRIAMDRFVRLQGDYEKIVQCPNPLMPPIFTSDENMFCAEWNAAMEVVTGWRREEVIGKLIPGEVFGNLCRLKHGQDFTKLYILLLQATGGRDVEKAQFGFFNRCGEFVCTFLTISTRSDTNGRTIGCIGFLQVSTPDGQKALEFQEQSERMSLAAVRELAYTRQEMKNPLRGVSFARGLLEKSTSMDDARNILQIISACEMQAIKIIEDNILERIHTGSMELENSDFILGSAVHSAIGQAMPLIEEKNARFLEDIPQEIKAMEVHGDQPRLQQVLADLLVNAARNAPPSDGWVRIDACRTEPVSLQFWIGHSGQCSNPDAIQDMFHGAECRTEEGLVLNAARKILRLMNGDVRYISEAESGYFIVDIELPRTRRN